MSDPSKVRMTGPLAPFAAGFASELARQGYLPNSPASQLHLMAHLSRWTTGEALEPGRLTAPDSERFLAHRRSQGYTLWLSAKAPVPGDLVRNLQSSRAQSLAMDQRPSGTPVERQSQAAAAKRALLADPPAWAVEALGPVPLEHSERQRWAEQANHLASYRDAYGITGTTDALGPRPADLAQRRAWEVAQLAILENQRSLEIERGLAI